tara:strand:+ start:186 stop:581 length:396 start_codon:yes stop_codon:yes gene_type:complete
MKSSLSVLGYAVISWIIMFAMLLVPQYTKSYMFNLLWMTIVAPNAMRYAVGMAPQLAVNRQFFGLATFISLILVYVINLASPDTREAMMDSRASDDKKLKLSGLLSGTFALGALISWQLGDTSIYSNMGWN